MTNQSNNRIPIFDPYFALTTLRENGYRSTATAIAELIDNSLEAKARDIMIITKSCHEKVNERTSYRVQEIAVLDNGSGMTFEVISQCLSIGWGTKLESRNGLGRFGFGLKGASISQARRLDIYSWQDTICYHTFLDIDEVQNQIQMDLLPAEPSKIPSWYRENLSNKIEKSGTLVVWSKLDRIDLAHPETLFSRMEGDLCRIYRHFLVSSELYGDKRNVRMVDFNVRTKKKTFEQPLYANDPLYLLEPSNTPSSDGTATNLLHGKPYKIDVDYAPGKKSEIEITLSMAKPKTQEMGGNSELGKHYARNTGISFVRAGREIDFGSFGFIQQGEPRHRWWGVEVKFTPVLDELFGVTNSKQDIRGFRKIDERSDEKYLETLRESVKHKDSKDYYKAKLFLDLNKALNADIKSMMETITRRHYGGKRPKGASNTSPPIVGIANDEVTKDVTPTSSESKGAEKTYEEKLRERIELLEHTRPELDEDQRRRLAEETIDYKVDLKKDAWPGTTFLDVQIIANAAVGAINTRSEFYKKFWQRHEDADDIMGLSALEIITLAFVRSEDEFRRDYGSKMFDEFRERWGYWVSDLLKKMGD